MIYLSLSPVKSTSSIFANPIYGLISATSSSTLTLSPEDVISYSGRPTSCPINPLKDLATPSTDKLSGRLGKNSTLISSSSKSSISLDIIGNVSINSSFSTSIPKSFKS